MLIHYAELRSWKCPKKAPSDPPGLLHATMTEVGRHGIFLFGGQSKRVTNAVYKCDPSTITWSIVDTAGVRAHICIPPALHFLSEDIHSLPSQQGVIAREATKVILMKRCGFSRAHIPSVLSVCT